jgi:flagellar motor switch protein FliG
MSGGMEVSPRNLGREGAEKAAILLLAMGKPLASEILGHFSAEELREIPRLATELGPVSASELEVLVEEFAGQFSGGVKFLGTGGEVEKLLTEALSPEQMKALIPAAEPVPEAEAPVWERLSSVPDAVLVTHLGTEHPQTAAAVLSQLAPSVAARLVSQMPPVQRHAIVSRMCSLRPLGGEAVAMLERALAADLLRTVQKSTGPDSRARMADILNRLEKEEVDELIARLEMARPADAEALKRMLFSFEDLPRLSAAHRTALMDKVPTDRLVVALRGVNPAFQDVVLSSLASRARRMVEAELASGEAGNAKDIAAARRQISEMALDMAARGEIELIAPAEDEGDR